MQKIRKCIEMPESTSETNRTESIVFLHISTYDSDLTYYSLFCLEKEKNIKICKQLRLAIIQVLLKTIRSLEFCTKPSHGLNQK